MILFAVLVAAFAVSYLVLRHGRHRDAARWAMAVAMMFAGVSHFLDPASFVQMLPEIVPSRPAVILGTGVIEILLGAGLLIPRRRRREIALALIAYLIAVFPANVYVAVTDVPVEDLGGGNPGCGCRSRPYSSPGSSGPCPTPSNRCAPSVAAAAAIQPGPGTTRSPADRSRTTEAPPHGGASACGSAPPTIGKAARRSAAGAALPAPIPTAPLLGPSAALA
jgi:uncharacterized membrane protein